MFMKWIAAVIGGSLFLGICCISCVEYTPKPRGYVRIEPSKAQYKPLDLSYLPFNFDVSQTAVIEVPDQKKGVTGLNISYPIQFLLTDSVSNFFRGALYFDCKPNADSLAPAIQYIREDIIELIQTFSWKE